MKIKLLYFFLSLFSLWTVETRGQANEVFKQLFETKYWMPEANNLQCIANARLRPDSPCHEENECAKAVTTTDNQRLAVGLVEELLDTLKNESQFSYDKGQYFFRGMNYLEFVLLKSLEYQDKAGLWLKPKPAQSYLGSLLMMNKNLVLPSSSEDIPSFSVVDIDDPEGGIYDKMNVVVVYDRDKNDAEYFSAEKHRTLVFHVNCQPDHSKGFVKIDLQESLVDGVSMAYLLGFRVEDKEVVYAGNPKTVSVPYYPEDMLRELEAFVEKTMKANK